MRIDIHNYEAFFLDYKEGNLDANQVEELFAFLEEYPQLRVELESFEAVTLEAEEAFIDKSFFKKNELSEETLIAYTENVLDEKGRREVEVLSAQNAALAKEIGLYRSAVLVADEKIKFPDKNRLKKGGVVIFLQSNPVYLRVAAAVLLLAGLFFLLTKTISTGSQPKNVLANEKSSEKNNSAISKNNPAIIHPEEKNLASNNSANQVHSTQHHTPAVNLQVAKNESPVKVKQEVITPAVTVNTNTVLANNENKKSEKDSIADSFPVTTNAVADNNVTYKSYYNYSRDDDDNDEQPVTASAEPAKKSLFNRLTRAARKANVMGVKALDGEEQNRKNSIRVGGLVLSESFSN